MILVAVMGAIALIYWITVSITKRIERTHQQNLQTKDDAIKIEINRINNFYRFPDILIMGSPSKKSEMRVKQYHKEIMQRVNQYQEETKNIRNDLAELHRQNDAILACPDCYFDEQKLSFLHKETARFEELKEKITALVAEYTKHRIILPDDDDAALVTLKNALKKMYSSNKVKIEGAVSLRGLFDKSKFPKELSLFEYIAAHIGISFNSFTFCLFPKTILVFKEDTFQSAIYPSELNITVSPVAKSARFSDGKYTDDIVDTDSKCIEVGSSITTWMHVCKDGSPDLRYNYNPSTEYRIDHMKYGKVKFEIAGFSGTFSFSSYDALESLEKATQMYRVRYESDFNDQQLVPSEAVDFHSHEVTEFVDNQQNSLVQKKKHSNSEQLKKTIAAFDALFSNCITPQDIVQEYVVATDHQELMKSTQFEILRFYLQHYSRLKSYNWTKEYIQDLISEQIHIRNNSVQIDSAKSFSEKQCTSPIAVPSSKVTEHERADSFATFYVAEDKEKVVSEYQSQKIDYQSSIMKKPVSKDPYKYFKKMRTIKSPQNAGFSVNGIAISASGVGDARQFVAQAKYMETFEDNYEGHADFQCYYSTYMNMNDEQLRTYFTWRARVRNGQVEATDISYAFVYIYELLNLIGVASAEEGMHQLLLFWSSYRCYDDKIDHYLERWAKEFYVYYRLSCSYKNVLAQFPDGIPKESSAQEEIFQHDYQNKDTYMNQLSSYKYLKSKFYESELGYTLIECIPLVLERIDAYLAKQDIFFPTLLLGNITTSDWWHPFSGAVVDVKNRSESYTVKINLVEEYSFTNGKWRSKKIQSHYYNNLLGYIIKTTEAELRILTGYKRKLKPNVGSVAYDSIKEEKTLKIINHPEFTDVIRNTVKDYFSNSGISLQEFRIVGQNVEVPIKPAEVKVDFSKLEAIRSAAAEIQERLVIDDNETGQLQTETVELPEEVRESATSIEVGQAEVVLDEAQEKTLSKSQRICISIITSGQNVNSRIQELAMTNGTLPGVLIEGINDLLFEAFGDNVIDSAADVPYIYDDYLDDVKKIIEED